MSEFDVCRRQILTSKVDPRTVRVIIFIITVHTKHKINISSMSRFCGGRPLTCVVLPLKNALLTIEPHRELKLYRVQTVSGRVELSVSAWRLQQVLIQTLLGGGGVHVVVGTNPELEIPLVECRDVNRGTYDVTLLVHTDDHTVGVPAVGRLVRTDLEIVRVPTYATFSRHIYLMLKHNCTIVYIDLSKALYSSRGRTV